MQVKDVTDLHAEFGRDKLLPVIQASVVDVPTQQSEETENKQNRVLPAWTDAFEFCLTEIQTPSEIIKGVLHRGCKAVIGGTSKMRKTFLLLDLALAVSNGTAWLKFETTTVPVLLLNLELPTFAIQRRLLAIARSRGLGIKRDTLTLWNLRGHAAPYDVLLPQIIAQAKARGFGLIILDPIYKLYGEGDENSAADTALLLNAIERLAVETDAAIVFTAHFAKGNAANKEAMDRISGSGVFARDPDTILICTALQTADAFRVDSILRTLPPQPPFAIQWHHPVFEVAEDLDPADLKQPQGKRPTPTSEEVLALFDRDTTNPRTALLSGVELRAKFDERGWDRVAAPAVRDRLEAEGKLKIYRGTHNAKLTGLPDMVDAYKKQLNEEGTLLEQTILPAKTKPRKWRKK